MLKMVLITLITKPVSLSPSGGKSKGATYLVVRGERPFTPKAKIDECH